MKEKLILSDLMLPEFRTSEAASKKTDLMEHALGPPRYGPARLALALSLADKTPVSPTDNMRGKAIRGQTLFGESSNMAAWVALFTQHADHELDRADFNVAVAAHWARGIGILSKMWEGADKDFDKFITDLAAKSGLPQETSKRISTSPMSEDKILQPSGIINLYIGEYATGDAKGKDARWHINSSSGYPPHIAVMGASGGGKTRLALGLAEEIHTQSNCATFIFDIKGDISENSALCQKMNAQVIQCPGEPIPLDILHVATPNDNPTVQNTAARLCDSLSAMGIKGTVQTNTLRTLAAQLIAKGEPVSLADLREKLIEKYDDDGKKHDSVIATLGSICDFNLFTPTKTPEEFFGRNWVFAMNNASDGIKKFSALMILDALNRYISGLPEAPVDSGNNRQINVLLVIDEAHKILGFKDSALNDIIRLSRSKGGAVILISQSPEDYMQEDKNFLENIGLTVSFRTNASPSSIKKVFSETVNVAQLGKGMCYALRSGFGESPKKIKVWG